jgi:hypothetical protein
MKDHLGQRVVQVPFRKINLVVINKNIQKLKQKDARSGQSSLESAANFR